MTEILFWISIFLFWGSVIAVFHSYIFYPIILKLVSLRKKSNSELFSKNEDLPLLSILMSLYNEEEVISEKIQSIYNTSYPKDKIEVLIGSDNSDDNTNALVEDLSKKYKSLKFYPFKERQGKANIINRLYDDSKGDILILTDANVMFETDTIFNLIRNFKNKRIGLVDTNMINNGLKNDGISMLEKAYISREVRIKNMESKAWGTMIGPFGGCFAIKKELFTKVPANFLVDDFYINMKVLERGYNTINVLDARVFEDVSNNLKDEFKRKVRISTGNFQNLKEFSHLIFSSRIKGLSFSFFSHKAIRWISPFLIIVAFISNLFLAKQHKTYEYLFYLQCIILTIPIIEFILRKLKIHIIPLRLITHFYSMNLALFLGFFKFIKGVTTNVWKPTKRNQ